MSFKVTLDGQEHVVSIVARRPNLIVRVNDRTYVVDAVCDGGSGARTIRVDGSAVAFTRALSGDGSFIRLDGRTFEARLVDPATEAAAGGGANVVRAPMPGAVVSVQRTVGAAVRRGETILTIESMKLQMALNAPRDGVIAELPVREGDVFDKDAVLARLEAPALEG